MVFDSLPHDHFGAILADPPWRFEPWSMETGGDRAPDYETMQLSDIMAMPVEDLAKKDSVLFLWITWPMLLQGLAVMSEWGFKYKTCAFSWMKADVGTLDMFGGDVGVDMGSGYWTRANSEVCLLGTRGKPSRLNADVRQGFISPRREHSRKPDGLHDRIERLVCGPYLELFARQQRKGWIAWGNQTTMFRPPE